MAKIKLRGRSVHKIVLVLSAVLAAYEVGVNAFILYCYAYAHGIARAVQTVKG